MASTFDRTGLLRKLTWADFGQPKAKPAPGPGQHAVAALTDTAFSQWTYNIDSIRQGSSFVYRLRDNIRIRIQFKQATSWVADWVFSLSSQEQTELLKHEQGHYEIVALMGRDLFIDLMQLKPNDYKTAQKAQQEVQNVKKRYTSTVIQSIHDKYDSVAETEHGADKIKQAKWDKYFKKAFSDTRKPAVTAPDGVAYKMRLLDVLKQAGVAP